MTEVKKYGWAFALCMLLVGLLMSCENQSDTIGSEKRQQNDEEIRAYLSQKGISAQRTTEGLYYKVVSKGSGSQKATVGDLIKVTYIASRLDGVLVDSSEISLNNPVNATFGVSRLPYFSDQAMKIVFENLLTEGDSALLFLPSYLSLGATGTLLFPAYSPVRIDLRVTSISTETEQIADFIKNRNILITETTASGLRFGKLVSYPDSAQVKDGSMLKVKYTGRRMDYTIFDSGTLDVTVGSTSVVPGFKEGLLKMRAGEKANLLFPSSLGYGPQGSNRIAGFSPLYFEVEIVSKTK
jgi:FKBP-type peptidyl-prolyl cis-trans isomerase